MHPGIKEHYVLSGDPVSLVCGYNLHSNPSATITWTNPQGKSVTSGDTYTLDNGPEVVQLNITNTSRSDCGKWACTVKVEDTCVHRVVEGKLKQECSIITPIGHKYFDTELVVVGECKSRNLCKCNIHNHICLFSIVPPSQPYDLSIADCGLTCIQLHWHQPDDLGTPTLSHFEVIYIREDGIGSSESVGSSINTFNFTEVVLGKVYQFSVVAVSVAGGVVGRSPQSDPIQFSGGSLDTQHS